MNMHSRLNLKIKWMLFFNAAMHPFVADSALEPSILSLHHAVNWTLKHFKPCTPFVADCTASTQPLHHAIEPQGRVNLLLDMYCLMQKQLVSYMLQIEFHEYCVPVFSTRSSAKYRRLKLFTLSQLYKCSKLNLKNLWTLIHPFMNCCMKQILNP